jgi:hypothetical protein
MKPEYTKLKPFDRRPQRGWWAPGSYMRQCYKCKVNFTGAKHSHMCADCAYAIPEEPADKAENPVSDTPRTDSEKQRFILEDNLDDTEMVPSKFCETLEKELNAANARIKKLEGIILELTAAGNCVEGNRKEKGLA